MTLSATHHPLPITYHLLPITYYLLPFTYYLLSYSLSPETVKSILILEGDEKTMLIPQFFAFFAASSSPGVSALKIQLGRYSLAYTLHLNGGNRSRRID
jgi:hypothetical protein